MNNFNMLKVFGTGQITIPKVWREKLKTDRFAATLENDVIILKPVITENIRSSKSENPADFIKKMKGAFKGIDTTIIRESDRI